MMNLNKTFFSHLMNVYVYVCCVGAVYCETELHFEGVALNMLKKKNL